MLMAPNWLKVQAELIKVLTDLIKINTTNPPGNEIQAAVYLKEYLEKDGIQSTIYESAPGRGNLVARLPGSGSCMPLILLAHLDVVGANPGQWSKAPFSGVVDANYVWGRGALDMKGMLAMELLTMLLLKRNGHSPKRDILFVAAADEEAGGVYGMEWLMKQSIPGLKEAEFVINEGGEGTIRDGIPIYSCQNGEKGILWVKLSVKGTPGHASMPSNDNAILALMKALNRISQYKMPLTLTETPRNFLNEIAMAKGHNLPAGPEARDLSLKIFAKRYFKNERSVQAMLYNTISPTIIKAGEKANVLPEIGELTLDCRLLPGETPEEFLKKLTVIINNPAINLEIISKAVPTESSINTELFRIIKKRIQLENEKALVVPYLAPGGTDSRFFRHLGITAYGFMPIIINETELQRMHGIDERISLHNLQQGTRILYETVRELA
jgi:acetylornithine deacetylase/succinyl-diaminopimelate desuccinylase-like protein